MLFCRPIFLAKSKPHSAFTLLNRVFNGDEKALFSPILMLKGKILENSTDDFLTLRIANSKIRGV